MNGKNDNYQWYCPRCETLFISDVGICPYCQLDVNRGLSSLSSIADGIAAMFLKEAKEKGYGLEIPSLGIKIPGKALDKDNE